jgi:hypothetical protein
VSGSAFDKGHEVFIQARHEGGAGFELEGFVVYGAKECVLLALMAGVAVR